MRAAALLALALLAGVAGVAGVAEPTGVALAPARASTRPPPPARFRRRRAPHSLLGPFDLSRLLKKKKPKPKPEPALDPAPSAFPLRAAASPGNTGLTALPLDAPVPSSAPNSTAISVLSSPSNSSTSSRTSETSRSVQSPDFTASPSSPPEHPLFTPADGTIGRARAVPLNTTLGLDEIDDRIVFQTTMKTPKQKSKGKSRKIKMSNNSTTSNGSKSRSASARRSAKPAGGAGAAGGGNKQEEPPPWPVKHAAIVEGDIILGGLMMVHGRSEGATCGPVMAQGGVQALEAMLFALDHAARAQLAPPGLRVGALVLDDCDNDTYGLEMALDFIKGSISNIEEEQFACAAEGAGLRPVISGVVGAASSVTSVQVANLLRLFKIPQVSYFSTSPELSNKQRFEYFTRTIPSDLHQVRAMVAIVKTLGWRYVSIIYEESNYGIKAFEELETLLARNEICIAVKERLVKDSGEAPASAYDAIVTRLLSRPRARGVIVFGSDQEVAGVMAAVQRAGAEGAFGWVGSDGWSARALVAAGRERAVEGTISVQPLARPVRGFREYFLNLTVQNNRRNPWFVEFWEEQFQCRWEGPGAARTPYNAHARRCSGRERLAPDTELEAQLQFVADAVLALVHALRAMHAAECRAPGPCAALARPQGPALLHYLRNVRFTGLSGEEFHFDANGDGPARYNILHFKQVERGVFRWLKVGRYLDGELELDMDEIQFKWDSPRPPESVCSAECELGQAKQYVEGESCCWHCFNCTQYEIRAPESETACRECPRGTLPDATRMRCAPLPAQYLRPGSPAARGAMAFSAVGIVCTMFVLGVWVRRGDTPVVRASGRELSYVLLAGILMCYLVTFVLVLRPTDALCTVQRFGTGLCFTIVYAALLTKTNRIARIFAASSVSARRPACISPRSQLLACGALVGAQLLVLAAWQAAAPARAVRHLPARDVAVLVCDAYVDASYTLAFSYPAALIATCTVYAVLTRKIPEAFNESKHIGFTMYTTCVIWLAFVPLYFGTASHVTLRVTTIAVTISLSATVTLACLFAPKVYIILLRPERNVRASLMPGRWRAGAGAGAAGGAVCAALVGAAAPLPAPRAPAATPSTDRSTLNDNDRTPSSYLDRQVQTDPLEQFPALPLPPAPPAAGGGPAELALSARALASACAEGPGLPPFALREAPALPNGRAPPAPPAPPTTPAPPAPPAERPL